MRIFNGYINHMEYENSCAELDKSLIEFQDVEDEDFHNRIDHYAWEKIEEVRTRYNRHLHGKNKSTTKELKAIVEEDEGKDKENDTPHDPNIEEESIDTETGKKRESMFQQVGVKKTNGQKEDDTIQLEIDLEKFMFDNTTVFNIATNVILSLFQHTSFDMIKYALNKIPQMVKLAGKDKENRSSNIFRILSVGMSIKIKHRERRNQFMKLILSHLNDIKRNDSVQISLASCQDFYTFFSHLSVFYDSYTLDIRQESVIIMHHYLKEYIEFLEINKEERQNLLKNNTFLHQNFKDLFVLANETEEDIRFIATDSLMVYLNEFLPEHPIVKGDAYNQDLADIRKDISKAFYDNEK
jgi:hypothetical protein